MSAKVASIDCNFSFTLCSMKCQNVEASWKRGQTNQSYSATPALNVPTFPGGH